MKEVFENVLTVTDTEVPATVTVEDGVISAIAAGGNIEKCDKVLLPLCVDTHIHGAMGFHFSDAACDFTSPLAALLKAGTLSVCATFSSFSEEATLLGIKNLLKIAKSDYFGTKIDGVHLEGPFLSRKYKGGMNEEHLREPDAALLKRYLEAGEGLVKIVTLAPELEGVGELIDLALRYGVQVSMGHTDASYEEAEAAVNRGARRMTHTFNACRPITHRTPGVLNAALTDDRIVCEVIGDEKHIDKSAADLIFRVKPQDGVTLVSDAQMFAGLPDGRYDWKAKNKVATVKDGLVYLENGTISGSAATLRESTVKLLKRGISPAFVAKISNETPSAALGLAGKYSLAVGKAANFTVFDRDFNAVQTVYQGKVIS